MAQDTPTTEQARARLRSVLGWRSRPATAISTVLLAVLGFVAAVQFATPDDVLDRASRADLVQILDGLSTRAEQLEYEIARLEQTRSDLLAGAGDSESALTEAEERLQTLGILAGTLPAAGPGVEVTISDPDRQMDASSMLSTIQELRDAGAEALQIEGSPDRRVRVVASTAFTDSASGGVLVGEVNLLPPYAITALGDPSTLATALGIPGGAVATIEGRGAAVSIRESADLTVDALHEPAEPSYARPALPEGQDAG